LNEAGRFIRFVIPGLVSLIVLGVMFLITDSAAVIKVVIDDKVASGIGFPTAVFLASGALGYVYANLYFMLFKWCERLVQNHKPLFEGEHARFRAVDAAGNVHPIKKRHEAWILVCQYVYSRLETQGGKDLRGMNDMSSRFIHHIHSHGAAAVGVFVAGIVWLLCKAHVDGCGLNAVSCTMWWGVISLWLLLQLVFWFTRCQTIKKHDRIMNSFLMDRNSLANRPEKLYYIK